MVINDVEDDANAELMRLIDEGAHGMGMAVERHGRVETDPVITPAEAAWKIGHRHHFQQRDPCFLQIGQSRCSRSPRAFARERADVHFVDDLAFDGQAGPVRVRPGEGGGIDHFRPAMGAAGLKARGWVRIGFAAVQAQLIKSAFAGVLRRSFPEAIRIALQVKFRAAIGKFHAYRM